MIFADYYAAMECENPEAYCICLKCGKCGRKFDCGFMVDDGGYYYGTDSNILPTADDEKKIIVL